VPAPHETRRHAIKERARRAHIEGAEKKWQRHLGRPMTAPEMERVSGRDPGDPFATKR